MLPTVRDALKSGAPVAGLALVEAFWARMCEGTREDGSAIAPNDPAWGELQAAASIARKRPRTWLEQRRFYGDLAQTARFADAFDDWLAMIWRDGAEATLRAYLSE